jgi:hypothetical protein
VPVKVKGDGDLAARAPALKRARDDVPLRESWSSFSEELTITESELALSRLDVALKECTFVMKTRTEAEVRRPRRRQARGGGSGVGAERSTARQGYCLPWEAPRGRGAPPNGRGNQSERPTGDSSGHLISRAVLS